MDFDDYESTGGAGACYSGSDRACAECSDPTEDDEELCPSCYEQLRAARMRTFQAFLGGELLGEVQATSKGEALIRFVGSECARVGTNDSSDPRVRRPDIVVQKGKVGSP